MTRCFQAPGLNMLQHGKMVHVEYVKLLEQLENRTLDEPVIQQCYDKLKQNLPPHQVLKRYHYLHDCFKHGVITIDENGKRHFPNHAEWSAKQYSHIFPEDGFTATLIRRDMEFHTLRGDDLLCLCESPFALILYFTAWAEINANAEMFGGRESDSYKIKRKRLMKAAKKLLNIHQGA